MLINRRVFSTALVTGAPASLISARGMAANSTPAKASNVVVVHGLFADGSCWSRIIPRLQAAGLHVTSVHPPLTARPEAVDSALRVLARQDGPTFLAGHSFSRMIVIDAGVHPDGLRGEGCLIFASLRRSRSQIDNSGDAPPASTGIMFDADEGRLSKEASLRDFAGDSPEPKTKVLYAVQWPFHEALLTGKTIQGAWRSKPSYYAVSTGDRTINPSLECFMVERIGANPIKLKADHLFSLISHSEEITPLILETAGQQA